MERISELSLTGRLTAAAPDLLEAVQKQHEVLRAYAFAIGMGEGTQAALVAGAKAIAKATGDEQETVLPFLRKLGSEA